MNEDVFIGGPLGDEVGQPAKKKPAPEELLTARSKYEFVMAAAREAERLNDYYRNHGIQPSEKVTSEAVGRVRDGKSKIIYEEPKPVEEESRKESTYFFGP